MKAALVLAGVAEAATGLALLIVPSLVGQLLLGEQLAGVAIPVARVAGIALIGLGDRLLAGPAARRHADLQRSGHAVSCLPRPRERLWRRPPMAGRHSAPGPDSAPGQGSTLPNRWNRLTVVAMFAGCRAAVGRTRPLRHAVQERPRCVRTPAVPDRGSDAHKWRPSPFRPTRDFCWIADLKDSAPPSS